jgi:hypothetical protein
MFLNQEICVNNIFKKNGSYICKSTRTHQLNCQNCTLVIFKRIYIYIYILLNITININIRFQTEFRKSILLIS